jgi:hypothetical protein
VPGATARQALNFGDATGGPMAGEYFSLAAGTDLAPLLKGLVHDMCQSPHWGYLISGEFHVQFQDGSKETIRGGDLFYMPAGHTLVVGHDSEIILFSPQAEHCAVVEHIRRQLSA